MMILVFFCLHALFFVIIDELCEIQNIESNLIKIIIENRLKEIGYYSDVNAIIL
jgi:hypothetical protein